MDVKFELTSVRERLYDLALGLTCANPDASNVAMDLYRDLAYILREVK